MANAVEYPGFLLSATPVATTRSSQGFYVLPPVCYPLIDRVWVKTHQWRPFRNAAACSVHAQHNAVAPISHLFGARGPCAVLWRVAAVVVDALQHVSGRGFWSHVSTESLETTQPSVADSDSATTVVVERFRIRVQTAVFHLLPRGVFAGMFSSVMTSCSFGLTHTSLYQSANLRCA